MNPEMNMTIEVLQLLDVMIHDEMREKILTYDFDKLMVLYRRAFPDAKLGDTVNGGKVVEIFTHTVWILHDDVTHDYCCPRENCGKSCHFCGEDARDGDKNLSVCRMQRKSLDGEIEELHTSPTFLNLSVCRMQRKSLDGEIEELPTTPTFSFF
jgi:hypothetical protein